MNTTPTNFILNPSGFSLVADTVSVLTLFSTFCTECMMNFEKKHTERMNEGKRKLVEQEMQNDDKLLLAERWSVG